jgi:hypothetical protein
MHEFKKGTLHSGSKNGPVVKSRAQAIAIGMNDRGGDGPKARLGKALHGLTKRG